MGTKQKYITMAAVIAFLSCVLLHEMQVSDEVCRANLRSINAESSRILNSVKEIQARTELIDARIRQQYPQAGDKPTDL